MNILIPQDTVARFLSKVQFRLRTVQAGNVPTWLGLTSLSEAATQQY